MSAVLLCKCKQGVRVFLSRLPAPLLEIDTTDIFFPSIEIILQGDLVLTMRGSSGRRFVVGHVESCVFQEGEPAVSTAFLGARGARLSSAPPPPFTFPAQPYLSRYPPDQREGIFVVLPLALCPSDPPGLGPI